MFLIFAHIPPGSLFRRLGERQLYVRLHEETEYCGSKVNALEVGLNGLYHYFDPTGEDVFELVDPPVPAPLVSGQIQFKRKGKRDEAIRQLRGYYGPRIAVQAEGRTALCYTTTQDMHLEIQHAFREEA